MALGRGNIEIDIRGNLDISGIARQVSQAEKKIRPINLSLNEKGFRQPLGRISGDLAEFQKSLDASVARTLAFGAAVGVINSVSNAFKGLVTSAVEVEKALTDVNVILNLSSQGLQQFSDQLFDVAKNTGQSFQNVSEAAVELSRQGLGAEETLKRINDAMILTRLSGMDAAKSVETLTAAVNSFGDTALTTTDLVNKLATVDAAFAVSTEDLSNALARSGASAQAAKVDLNELLAAVTSVQQTTARGGSVIGNAFKSIFTRIQRSGVREALEDIGVATTDAAGNIRGALDILQDYAGVYGTLTDAQRAYTDELVAGVFQINNLRALVKDLGSDYSIYNRALDQSNNATDEAIRRNEQLQGTLSALINEASVNAKELAATLGDLVATPAVENLLNIFNSIAGALKDALDPEQGNTLIKGIFTTIGKFISGPGLIIVGAAFIKLFKFITQQSLAAVKEIFQIGSAANKVADAEAKIGFLLKNNRSLYEAISNEALTHEQREELVLQTIKQQNQAYQQQQNLISRLAKSRGIQSVIPRAAEGHIPTAARGRVPESSSSKIKANADGFIPNFANGLQGAIQAEKAAVASRIGGASKSAKPQVLNNFPMGGGKRQTIVANTDEVIVPRFGGGTGSAIFNQDMIKKYGMPKGAMPVSRGYVPSFAASRLQKNKQFQNILSDFRGIDIDVQRDLPGFGMLSAKGSRGNLKVTKKPGFKKEQKLKIIETIGGSRLNRDDKNYLLTTIGDKKKTTFSNIPSQTIESADPKEVRGKVGALNNIINPYIADAVANVATNVYTRVLGDEVSAQNLVKSVRASANTDKGIISVGAQGDIFESAVRLGSKASAKNLARDDRSAIWDFEESGSITPDLKSLFFPTSNIIKADAKRSGDQASAGEVINKAYKETFDDQIQNLYARNWAPIVDAAVKAAPATQETARKRTGTNLAGGYIPNFITSIPADAIRPFQASQYTGGLFIPPKENDKVAKATVGKIKPQKAFLGNPKKQRADLRDLFKALIDVEYDRRNIQQFEKVSNPIANKLISGDVEWLNKIEKTSSKLVKRSLADPSSIQGIKTQINNLQLVKEAQSKGIKAQDIIAGKSAKANPKQKSYWKKYQTAIKDGKFKNKDNLAQGIRDKVKGVFGEYSAAIKQGTTVNTSNSYFDLANGKEVKTVKYISAENLLKKQVNEFLKSNNIFNKRTDNIGLDKISVIMPRDSKVNFQAADGFIPNFFGDKIGWKIDKAKGDYAITGSNSKLSGFSSYLKEVSEKDSKIVSPRAAEMFEKRVKEVNAQHLKDKEETSRRSPIGSGRQGAKHYAAMDAVSRRERSVSTKGLFIKDLGKHVKQYNQHDIFAADKIGSYDSFLAEGYIPNFANQVYDKDKIEPQVATEILENILTNRKKKDLFIGPSGVGKSTLAAKYGDFIKSLEDAQEATSYTILSGAGQTKAGGMSPALQKIISSVNKSGGRVSYLSASDKTIEERRQKRIGSPLKGDLRSEGQLKGTKYAPKNQPDFIDAIKRASNRFQVINAAEGMIPNFALSSSMMEGLRAKLRPGSGATEAEKRSARRILEKENRSTSFIKDAAIIDNLKFSKKQVQGAVTDVVNKRNSLDLDPQPIVIDEIQAVKFAEEYIKKVNKAKRAFTNEKLFGTSLNTNEISMALKGQGGYQRGKYIPTRARNMADGYIPNFANALFDAIEREKSALKSQGSSAKVYVDNDKRLKSSKNPMGLLVANRRDEPGGGFQGVNRAMSMGMDPKKHGMASGYIPNFANLPLMNPAQLKAYKEQELANKRIEQTSKQAANSLNNQTKENEGVTRSTETSLGGLFAFQLGLSAAETVLTETGIAAEGFSLKFTQLGLGLAETAKSLTSGSGKLAKTLGGVLKFAGPLGAASGLLFDLYQSGTFKALGLYDRQKDLIKSTEIYTKQIDKLLQSQTQSVEKVDKFSTVLGRLGKSAATGDIESYGKFLQQIIEQAGELDNIDPDAFRDLLESAGDSQKLQEATQRLKDLITEGGKINLFQKDFAALTAEIAKAGGDIGKIDFSDIKNLGRTLLSGLDLNQIEELNYQLVGVTSTSGDSSQALLGLQSVFGELSPQTKRYIQENEGLSKELVQTIKAQAAYKLQSKALSDEIIKARAPVKTLNSEFNKLSKAITQSVSSINKSFETLSKVEEIRAETRAKVEQATEVVTPAAAAQGQAITELVKAQRQASQDIKTSLRSFAAETIKNAKENTQTIEGPIKTLIDGIQSGDVELNSAIQSLTEIQKTGNQEQKDAAIKALDSIKATNQQFKSSQAIIDATLAAQLKESVIQSALFRKDNQLNESQLKSLTEFNNFGRNNLERLSGLKDAISLITSLGGNEDILAELKAANRRGSEFENLQSAFEQLTGQAFEAIGLDQLESQIDSFIQSDVFSKLDSESQKLSVALTSSFDKIRKLEEFKEEEPQTFEESLKSLNDQFKTFSKELSEGLKLNESSIKALSSNESIQKIASAIETTSKTNAQNIEKNRAIQKQQTEALLSATKDLPSSVSGLQTSTDNLKQATESLKIATDNLSRSNASGFVPSFAPNSEAITRAIQTERKLGGRPVVDYNSQIGTYVRDGRTQPNFAAVKRDHPEGIRKASQNSKTLQGINSAKGFLAGAGHVPNFISFGGTYDPSPIQDTKPLEGQNLKRAINAAFFGGQFTNRVGVPVSVDPAIGLSNWDGYNLPNFAIRAYRDNYQVDAPNIDTVKGSFNKYYEEYESSIASSLGNALDRSRNNNLNDLVSPRNKDKTLNTFRDMLKESAFDQSLRSKVWSKLSNKPLDKDSVDKTVFDREVDRAGNRDGFFNFGRNQYSAVERGGNLRGKGGWYPERSGASSSVYDFISKYDSSKTQDVRAMQSLVAYYNKTGQDKFPYAGIVPGVSNVLYTEEIIDKLKQLYPASASDKLSIPLAIEKSGEGAYSEFFTTSSKNAWSPDLLEQAKKRINESKKITEDEINKRQNILDMQNLSFAERTQLESIAPIRDISEDEARLLRLEKDSLTSHLNNHQRVLDEISDYSKFFDLNKSKQAFGFSQSPSYYDNQDLKNVPYPDDIQGDPSAGIQKFLTEDKIGKGNSFSDIIKNYQAAVFDTKFSDNARLAKETIKKLDRSKILSDALSNLSIDKTNDFAAIFDKVNASIQLNTRQFEQRAPERTEAKKETEEIQKTIEGFGNAEAPLPVGGIEEVERMQFGDSLPYDLYAAMMGKKLTNQSGENISEQIQKAKDKLPNLRSFFDNQIAAREKRVDRYRKFKEFPSEGNRDLAEIEALKKQQDLLLLEKDAIAYLLYSDSSKPLLANGKPIRPFVPTAPSDFRERYEKISKFTNTNSDLLELNKGLVNQEDTKILAKIATGAFLEPFKAQNYGGKLETLKKLGVRLEPKEESQKLYQELQKDSKQPFENLAKNLGAESDYPLGFLFNAIKDQADEVLQNKLLNEILVNKLENIGLPLTTDVPSFLNTKALTINSISGKAKYLSNAGFKQDGVLLGPEMLEQTNKVASLVLESWKEKNKRIFEQTGLSDSPTLSEVLTGLNQETLGKHPAYLNYLRNQGLLDIESWVNGNLNDVSSVDNNKQWFNKFAAIERFNNNTGFQFKPRDQYTDNLLADIDNDDIFKPKANAQGIVENPLKNFGGENATINDAIRLVFGGQLYHGTNKEFEKILKKQDNPFGSKFSELDNYTENQSDSFNRLARDSAENAKLNYAKFGYTKDFRRNAPVGEIERAEELLKIIETLQSQAAARNQAHGFVPNFSAVAGEIAASKTAGYQNPVTPSQVKTMSIPGIGKTAYNTQESVFKMPGVTQPFIAPPRSSKAAKPYAKEVEKKYNFNPYKKTAADGFVPNFQRGMDFRSFENAALSFGNAVDGFERYVSLFERSIESLDFRQFTSASQEIYAASQEFTSQSSSLKEAAQLIEQGASALSEQTIEAPVLDFQDLRSAASEFSKGVSSLSSTLNKPIELDSGAMVTAMNNLTNALGNIRGTVDVDIPDINVSVQGSQAIANSVKQVIQTEVPKLVQQEISNINIADQIRNYLR